MPKRVRKVQRISIEEYIRFLKDCLARVQSRKATPARQKEFFYLSGKLDAAEFIQQFFGVR